MNQLRVGLVLFAFTFGTSVATSEALFGNGWECSAPKEKLRILQQEDISEAVFRYQIEHFTPVDKTAYYLSVANDSDPSAETLARFKNSKLQVRRLSEIGTYPTSNSCYYCQDRELEFILRVGSVRWLNQNEVIVGGSLRRWHGDVDRAYLFRVVREQTIWVVKEHELL